MTTCRPLFPNELTDDADFAWLVSSFRSNHPEYVLVEIPSLPVVFLKREGGGVAALPSAESHLSEEEESER